MIEINKNNKSIFLRSNITQTTQIQLTRLNVCTSSTKGAKLHKCHLCKYSSKRNFNVKRHLRTHSGEKPFSCPLCNYKSSYRGTLNDHILTHIGEKHHKWAFCTKSFTRSHHKTGHEIICKLNPRQSDPSWVEMQKPFKCTLCPYAAAQKYSLKSHMRTHTGEKPFPCKLCNQAFSSVKSLQRHIFTHTREKPHCCQFCTKGFARVTCHKNHVKICKLNPKQGDAKWVEEQKKFKCHFCKYRTITKRNLERHLRLHTEEKPYKYPGCFYKCSNHCANLYSYLRPKYITQKGITCLECDLTILANSNKLLNLVKPVQRTLVK